MMHASIQVGGSSWRMGGSTTAEGVAWLADAGQIMLLTIAATKACPPTCMLSIIVAIKIVLLPTVHTVNHRGHNVWPSACMPLLEWPEERVAKT